VDLSTFIIGVFDITEDWFNERGPVRERGPAPKLSDSEVVSMEIIGEFLGIDTEKGIYSYFKRHYPHYFPKMREVHRTTFTRQAANLWMIKERLWQHLLEHELVLGGEEDQEPLMVIDSFPIPVCKKSRSYKCKVMREVSERGRGRAGQIPRHEGSRRDRVAWDNSESQHLRGERPRSAPGREALGGDGKRMGTCRQKLLVSDGRRAT